MTAGSRNHSVLVLEDDDAIRLGIVSLLRRLGHQVFAARTVAEAGAMLDLASPTHLVLDLNLPDGPGTDVLRWAKDRGLAVHAALVTGTHDVVQIADARAMGVEEVFVKPPDWDEVLAWVGRG